MVVVGNLPLDIFRGAALARHLLLADARDLDQERMGLEINKLRGYYHSEVELVRHGD